MIEIDSILNNLPALQVVVPLLLAPIAILISIPILSWIIAFIGSAFCVFSSLYLFSLVYTNGTIKYFMGGWLPPYGIEYVIDGASAFMIVVISLMGLLATLYSYTSLKKEISKNSQSRVYGMWLLALGGLLGLVTTGDAFNLFVFLEISSLSSVTLVALGAYTNKKALTAAFNYLLIGAVGATFYVIGVGLLYSVTGTLNISDLSVRMSEMTDSNALRAGISFIVIGLMIKAAIFPLHIWLPAAYSYAPTSVSVLLTATATKAALYVLARILFSLLYDADDFTYIILQWILLPASIVAIFFGTIRAIFEDDFKKILAFSSLSQIGYIVIGLSLGTAIGLIASFVHIANHAMMKAGLFMGAGSVSATINKRVTMTSIQGLGYTMPITSFGITILLLSLLGIPLTVGFVSKVYLLKAVFNHGNWPILFLIVLSSFMALGYVWKLIENIWMKKPLSNQRVIEKPSLYVPLLLLAGMNIVFGIYSYPIIEGSLLASEAVFWDNLS